MTPDQLALAQEAEAAFAEACRLQWAATESPENLGGLVEAAGCFERAASTYLTLANEVDEPEHAVQFRAYGHYYRFESTNAKQTLAYETSQLDEAAALTEMCLTSLAACRTDTAHAIEITTDAVKEKLTQQLSSCDFFAVTTAMKSEMVAGRIAWRAHRWSAALDRYRRAEGYAEKALEMIGKTPHVPPWRRVLEGNLWAFRMNAAQAAFMIVRDHGERHDAEDYLFPYALKQLFAARRSVLAAMDANPRWSQYWQGARNLDDGIAGMVEGNKAQWPRLLRESDNDPDLLRVMKTIDPAATDEALGAGRPSKLQKVVGYTALATIAVIALGGAISVAARLLSPLQFAFSAVATYSLIVVIQAFALRLIGDISEKSYLQLVRLALSQQRDLIRMLGKRRKPRDQESD